MTFNPTRKQLIVSLLRFVISILNYSSGSKYYSNYIFKTLIGQKRKKNPILFSFGDIVLVPYLDYMSIFHPMVKYSKFCSLSIIGNIITLSTLRAKKSPSAKPAWDSRDPECPGGIWQSDALMKMFELVPLLIPKVFLKQCHSWNATAKCGDLLMVYVHSFCFPEFFGVFFFGYVADLDLNWTCHAGVHVSWFWISPVLVAIVTSRKQKGSGKEESSFKQVCLWCRFKQQFSLPLKVSVARGALFCSLRFYSQNF